LVRERSGAGATLHGAGFYAARRRSGNDKFDRRLAFLREAESDMPKQFTLKQLEQEVKDFRARFRHLADDQLFVVWFLRAFVTESENDAADALCGGPRDKNIDAILIDAAAKVVFVVQGKYRRALAATAEKPNDVRSFAQLGPIIGGHDSQYESFCSDLSPETEQKLSAARKQILRSGYRLELYYVTLGRCSKPLADEAGRIAGRTDIRATMDVIDGRHILRLLADYLNGVAPPVPSLDLEMESGNGVEVKAILQRYDSATDIESWVFPMSSHAVAGLVERAGLRLFARNIRGFLGSTEINRQIEATLKSTPEYFWYYNNGITIVCDQAEEIRSQGRQVLRVRNPQVINGQQTSRTLHRHGAHASVASTLVKVIRVPRGSESNPDGFESLVSNIVSATNWQNKILPSDLRANDRRQIALERELRKLDYWYIRKRATKSESKRLASSQRYIMLRKDELAQAVAGCDLDPAIPRTQKEGLFEESYYSRIFSSKDPWYYLTRYRLLREVNRHARGDRDRGNAKWLVLHVVWGRVSPAVRSGAAGEVFTRATERNDFIEHLSKGINAVFDAVKQFYRTNKGNAVRAAGHEGDARFAAGWHRKQVVDVPTFFKRRGLHTEFATFWSDSEAQRRFDRIMDRFGSALKQELLS
jgi:AIPR protein